MPPVPRTGSAIKAPTVSAPSHDELLELGCATTGKFLLRLAWFGLQVEVGRSGVQYAGDWKVHVIVEER